MIKVHGVMAEGFFHTDKTTRASSDPQERRNSGDIVTISEEGKKKRVMGHVMASLTSSGAKKL